MLLENSYNKKIYIEKIFLNKGITNLKINKSIFYTYSNKLHLYNIEAQLTPCLRFAVM